VQNDTEKEHTTRRRRQGEESETAQHDGVLRTAIATVDVDDVLPVGQMPEALYHAARIGIFATRAATCRDRTMNSAGVRLLGLPDELNPSKTTDDGADFPSRCVLMAASCVGTHL
jgi:hypothetical protein